MSNIENTVNLTMESKEVCRIFSVQEGSPNADVGTAVATLTWVF